MAGKYLSTTNSTQLVLRHVIVGVIPIDGGVQGRIRARILRSGFIHFALDALFFLHFALFHPFHFFLPFLKGRCHSLSSLQSALRRGPGVDQLMQRAGYQRGSRGCLTDSR